MPNKKPRLIKDVLSEDLSGLMALSAKAQKQQTLLQSVCASLPDPLPEHVIAADISEEILTVVCTSAPWATRIRFYSQSLLENVAPLHNSTTKHVVVKVRSPWRSDSVPPSNI